MKRIRAYLEGLLTSEQFERLHELRHRALHSQDYREGLDAFRERRPPRFSGQ